MLEVLWRRRAVLRLTLLVLCVFLLFLGGCGTTILPPTDGNGDGNGDGDGQGDQTPGTLTGRVVDASDTTTAISGANVDSYVYVAPIARSLSAAGLLRQVDDEEEPEWNASSGTDGSFTISGVAPGTYEIKINPPQGADYEAIILRITVLPGANVEIDITLLPDWFADELGGIDVNPKNQTVAPGGTLNYTATIVDEAGDPLLLRPIWRVEGGVGRIDANGLFTAGQTPGRGRVVAQIGGRTASTAVTVAGQIEERENNPPRFDGDLIILPGATVRPGTSCLIGARASDPDGDEIFFLWDSPGDDTIWSTWAPEVAEWIAPDTEGTYTISCTVEDIWGATAQASVDITVSNDAPNSPPIIEEIFSSAPVAPPGGELFLECWAHDPDPDDNWDLSYAWSASSGTIAPEEFYPEAAVWNAPTSLGIYEITCTVTDRHGAATSKKRRLRVGGASFDVTLKGAAR